MKLIVRLLSLLCVLLLAVYATTPYWLPPILSQQLPASWQLQELKVSYPGLSGIHVRTLRLNARVLTASLSLSASELQVDYRGLAVKIDDVLLELHNQSDPNRVVSRPLGSIAPPVMLFIATLPEIKIRHALLRLRNGPANAPALALDIQVLHLLPQTGGKFHMVTNVSVVGKQELSAQAVLDAGPDSFNASLRLPPSPASPAWLTAALEQHRQNNTTSTLIKASLDAQVVSPVWFDTLIGTLSGGALSQISGKLEARAAFSGQEQEQQQLQTLSVSSKQLKAIFSEGSPLKYLLPEAHFQRQEPASAAVSFETTLHAIEAPHPLSEPDQSTGFEASINFSYSSATENITLNSSRLRIRVVDPERVKVSTLQGPFELDWEIREPIWYSSDALEISADRLSFSNHGSFSLADQLLQLDPQNEIFLELDNLQSRLAVDQSTWKLVGGHYALRGQLEGHLPIPAVDTPPEFNFQGQLNAQRTSIGLSDAENSPPVLMQANELSMKGALAGSANRLVSSGSGTLLDARLTPLEVSADKLNVGWSDLDLTRLTGKLTTRTKGLLARVGAITWPGFDLELAYSLSNNSKIDGRGAILFNQVPLVPVGFSGNLPSSRYHINVPRSVITTGQLSQIMEAAQLALPTGLSVSGGDIELSGEIEVGEHVSAQILAAGRQLGLSIRQSHARDGNFSMQIDFTNQGHGNAVSLKGPVSIANVDLAGGLDLHNLESELQAELTADGSTSLAINELHTQLLNGYLQLPSLQVSPAGMQQSVTRLSHIDLGRLLAIAAIDGLEGRGTLEINLPVGSDQKGFYISNGTFQSVGPGRLAYKKEGLPSSNIGLQALQNFEYKSLSGTIDYQADGNYAIVVRLQGSNPDLYGGHAIVFTLDINGTIPEIFEALFFTGDFDEAILKQLKQR